MQPVSIFLHVNAKRLGLLRELVPAAVRVAVLMNPGNMTNTSSTLAELEPAAHALGLQVQFFNASTSREIDAAFAAIMLGRPDALFVAPDGFFMAGGSNWPRWRHAMRFLRPIRCEILSRSVD